MDTVFAIFFYIVVTGFSIGGLVAGQREKNKLLQILFFIIFFFVLCYIGMIIGMFFSGWVSVTLVEYVIIVVALLFIVACASRYHPSVGFFHLGSQTTFFILISLFVFMGMEWGLLNYRTFFTLFSTLLFALSLLGGLIVQLYVRYKWWRHSFLVFMPLVWLFLASLSKLVR